MQFKQQNYLFRQRKTFMQESWKEKGEEGGGVGMKEEEEISSVTWDKIIFFEGIQFQ